jgi:D-3-phosphoglycerate dehydrogenase / 2-oxoglutarate reductase
MSILFTAPHGFLSEHVRIRYRTLGTRFLEAWYLQELDGQHDEVAWVPNPGQHFIVNDGVLELFPRLQVIATPSTGTNHLDLEACERRGLRVLSLLDDRKALASISASAEFAFLMMLSGLRRIDVGIREVLEGRWRSREDLLRGRELQGKIVGLVGFGRIGNKLAAYCRAFGSKVAYYDPYAAPNGDEDAARVGSLEDLLEASDIIVICCQLTEETRGMIRGRLIDRARRGAVIVNVSRGEVIDELELCEVLSRRTDLTFCADVVTGEVEDRHHGSPLMELFRSGRILLTPHIAGATLESQEKAAVITLALLEKEMTRR